MFHERCDDVFLRKSTFVYPQANQKGARWSSDQCFGESVCRARDATQQLGNISGGTETAKKAALVKKLELAQEQLPRAKWGDIPAENCWNFEYLGAIFTADGKQTHECAACRNVTYCCEAHRSQDAARHAFWCRGGDH